MSKLIIELIDDLALIENLKSRFNPLVDYYTKYGTISKITTSETYMFDGKDVRIGSLIATLRAQYKHGFLKPDVIKALESMGMVWKHDQFLPLREYYKKYGTIALIEMKETIMVNGQKCSIGNLISRLRNDYHQNLLSADEIAELESLGMVWKHDRMIPLREYYKQFGSLAKVKVGSNTSVMMAGKEINVANIIVTLRAEYKKGKLSNDEIIELESMGIVWSKQVECDPKLEVLTDYYNKFGSIGHLVVNDKYLYNGETVDIGKYIHYLRNMWRKGNLSKDKIKRLDDLGMVWRIKNKRVNPLELLSAYYNEFGTLANIKSSDTYDYDGQTVNIGNIVVNLRRDERKESLTEQEIKMLDKMGFVWFGGTLFDERIAPLVDYYNKNGSIDAVKHNEQYEYNGKILNISSLIQSLRYEARNNKLTDEQKGVLEAMGIVWDKKRQFTVKLDVLKAYYNAYGAIDKIAVKDKFEYNGEEYSIGQHIFELRARYREGKLNDKDIKVLEELGMVWRRRNEKKTFDEKYEILKEFTIKTNKTLNDIGAVEMFEYNGEIIDVALWIALFRNARKNGKLSDSQTSKLEQLGVNWNGFETKRDRYFENMYSILCEYALQHGGTISNIKRAEIYKYEDKYVSLGEMVSRLRKNRASYTEEQVERLTKLGMLWFDSKFDYKLSVLQDYIDNGGKLSAIGDVSIYMYQGRDERIGRWMKTYRKEYREGTLSQEKIDKLNAMGMVWDTTFNRGVPVKSR